MSGEGFEHTPIPCWDGYSLPEIRHKRPRSLRWLRPNGLPGALGSPQKAHGLGRREDAETARMTAPQQTGYEHMG